MTITNIQGDRLPPVSFRNKLINGDMRIDQRNVGAAYTVAASTLTYVNDRFYVWVVGNTASCQDVASGFQFTGRTATTTLNYGQRIEANNMLELIGQKVTFQAKISASVLTSVAWNAFYPTTALDTWTASTNFANGTFTINSTPTIYTTTFTVNAACGNGMAVEIAAGALTSGTLTTTDWQLELGSVPTPMERRPIQIELALCQRYFQKSVPQNMAVGGAHGAGNCSLSYYYQANSAGSSATFRYPVTMRIPSPGLAVYDGAGTASRYSYYSGSWQNGAQGAGVLTFDSGFNFQANQTSVSANFNLDYTANAEIL